MIWTGILLLTCHVIAAIGSENDVNLDVTKEVYDSNRNYRTRRDPSCVDCLRADSYTGQARQQPHVYGWSRLGRKQPVYSYNSLNRQLDPLERLDKQAYRKPTYENSLLSRNALSQGIGDYKDKNYQQLDNARNTLQLGRKEQDQGYSWNRLARQDNLNDDYSLDQEATQGYQGYRNPNSYSQLNQRLPQYLNQNRQLYQAPKYWKDFRQGYDNPSSLWNKQSREGSRKYYELASPYYSNSLERLSYPLKQQDRLSQLYHAPSYSLNRENLYNVPAYSTSGLNRRQLNRGALDYNRVPYPMGDLRRQWDKLGGAFS